MSESQPEPVRDQSATAAGDKPSLDQINVRCHTLQFLFLFQVPPDYAAGRDGASSILARRLEREGSIWRRLQFGRGGQDQRDLRQLEEATERLLPEVLGYLHPYVAEHSPMFQLRSPGQPRDVYVYRLVDWLDQTWTLPPPKSRNAPRACQLAPYSLDRVKNSPQVQFSVGLEASLYLFGLGQVALRLETRLSPLNGETLSLLTCLRFLDAFGSLDPTSYASKVGCFQFASEPESEPGIAGQAPKLGRFGPLALVNFLLSDLLAAKVAHPADERAMLTALDGLEQQVRACMGSRTERQDGVEFPAVLKLGQEMLKYQPEGQACSEAFPVWFNLDRMHRFGYLDLTGDPPAGAINQVLRWAEQGHSIAYLDKTPSLAPDRSIEVFPGDRCACNPSFFLGLQGRQGHRPADTKAVDHRLGQEVFSGYFLAAHQRQLVLGLSLRCVHEVGNHGSCGVCADGADLDRLAQRLSQLRFLFLQIQVHAMFSEVSVHPPLQRAYEFFLEAMNVTRAAGELKSQVADLQTFLEVRRAQQQAEDEKTQAREAKKEALAHEAKEKKQVQRERAFNLVAGVLASLAIPATVITGLFGTNNFAWDQPWADWLFAGLLLLGFALTGLLVFNASALLEWQDRRSAAKAHKSSDQEAKNA